MKPVVVLVTAFAIGCGASSLSDDFDGSEDFESWWSAPITVGDRVSTSISASQARSAPRSVHATANDPPGTEHSYRRAELPDATRVVYEFDMALQSVGDGYAEFGTVEFGDTQGDAVTRTLGIQPSADPMRPELYFVERHFVGGVDQPLTSLAGTIAPGRWMHVIIDAGLTDASVKIDGTEVVRIDTPEYFSDTPAARVSLGITSAGRGSMASLFFDNVEASASD
ncbi:MAG: hypothetical protein AB7O24_29990 [Kofleriaceae bacterium]